VELGRLDGKTFNRAIVKHVLPGPGFNLDQLNSLFAQNGLTQTDMIALSGTCVCSLPVLFFLETVLFYFIPAKNIHANSSSKRNLR
jgi:hypothetical protein